MHRSETSIRGRIARHLISQVTSSRLVGMQVKRGEHLTRVVEPLWQCPKDFTHVLIAREAFVMELLESEYPDCRKVILQLHGGGYIGKLRNAHRNMAKWYSELSGGMSVLSPDYRVAPEHPYPAALEDALSAFDWLLEKGYTEAQIIVVGDSAGGGLAMALCHYLKACGRPLPCGIIAMSPWTDMTASGKSYQFNFERDPLFGNTTDSALFNRDYLGDENEKKPFVSPLFGEFQGFPPMLIQAGSFEMLLSDSIAVTKKALEAGVRVRCTVYEGMFHDFQMAGDLIPESKRAWREVGEFIQGL